MKLVLNVNKLVSGTNEAYSQGVAYVAIYDERGGYRQFVTSEKIVGMINSSTYRRVVTGLQPPEGKYVIEVDPVRHSEADITMGELYEDDAEIPALVEKIEASIVTEDI